MIIGIDGLALAIKFPCGTKRYAQEIINGLARVDKNNIYIIFTPKRITIPNQPNFILKIIPSLSLFPMRQVLLPWEVLREKVDVFHYLHPYGSVLLKHPKIVTTIHDFQLDTIFPKNKHMKYLIQYFLNVFTRGGVIRHTNTFLCPSRFVKKELDKYLKQIQKSATSTVIYEGVNAKIFVPDLYHKRSNYCLCMADFSPRKNIITVLRAYRQLIHEFPDLRLKIIVSTHFSRKVMMKMIDNEKIRSSLIDILVTISQEELTQLYQQASCFIYPSLYEGFGLPILEAMACGCPVITSNRGAMKEVAGNAARLVNPKNSHAIADAVTELLTSTELVSVVRKKGLNRAAQFSWDRTAKETLSVYNDVYDA